jgi:condensin complex subunit 1
MFRNQINLLANRIANDSTLAELTSLDELLGFLAKKDCFDEAVLSKLWRKFSTSKDIPNAERRSAIRVLSMFARRDPSIMMANLSTAIKIGLCDRVADDPLLACLSCIALQKLPIVRSLPNDHIIFEKLTGLIINISCDDWFSIAEQAINAIYLLAEYPDVVCTNILVLLLRKCIGHTVDSDDFLQTVRSTDLSHLIFVGGHIAIKQIVYLETIERELKARKGTRPAKSSGSSLNNPNEDSMDQIVGSVEDEISDDIQRIREHELMYGMDSILSIIGPLTAHICAHNLLYSDARLRAAAVLSLAKFMCVSSEFCEKHLQLLVTVLERSQDATTKSNIVISLGDMAVSFNSLIDQNIAYLYKRLRDTSLVVKKNALMVLTHLILNGMIKIKGQLGEMAKCLIDSDPRIRDLAKLFFSELAGKDSTIYNNLPDIISNLSHGEHAVVEDDFRAIMGHLFSHLKRDRQSENLIEKLCHRFRLSDNERHWRDVAFCLSFLQYNSDRAVKKLADGLPYYQDKLNEPGVYESFINIVNRARKFQKPEMKQVLDDFERQIESARHPTSEEEISTLATIGDEAEKIIPKHSVKHEKRTKSSSGSRIPTHSNELSNEMSDALSSMNLVRMRMYVCVVSIKFYFILIRFFP